MRKRTLGVVLLAGLAISGGGAFTGSNAFSGTPDRAGYGSVTATGVTVSNVKYNTLVADASQLASVVFTVTQDVTTGHTSTMTLRTGVDGVFSTTSCDAAAAVNVLDLSLGYTITCNNADTSYANFESVGLTVVSTA